MRLIIEIVFVIVELTAMFLLLTAFVANDPRSAISALFVALTSVVLGAMIGREINSIIELSGYYETTGHTTFLDLWFFNENRSITLTSYRKSWSVNGNGMQFGIRDNGAKKSIKTDTCFDFSIVCGYLIFNYTNWDYQGESITTRILKRVKQYVPGRS